MVLRLTPDSSRRKMKLKIVLALGCTLAVLLCLRTVQAQQPITLTASDGVKVFGAYYEAKGPAAPIILLFHQAESSRYEYESISPLLVAAGFNVLAIDQRSGGSMWGHKNETVAHLGKSADYLEAMPDLKAALEWTRAGNRKGEVILWGSSYSASLVFILGAENPGQVAGILAFSPGEYFNDHHMIRDAAAKVHVPVFVTSAVDPDEIAAAKAILAAVPFKHTVQYVPIFGVHGSSTLRGDRNPKGAPANWEAVMAFLKQFHQ
jgi:dienelactone hydrolase